jgi:hypothetical protein
MTPVAILALGAALAAERAPAAQAPVQAPSGATIYFAVKASPQSSAAISRALQELAEPRQVALQPGETPQAALARACGTAAPKTWSLLPGAVPVVQFTPCLQTRREVRTKVTPNTSLEAIAVQLGLGPAQRLALEVEPDPRSGRKGPIAPTKLMPGDTVVARNVPAWTPFTPKAEVAASRDRIVRRFALALGCGDADPEHCLTNNDVFVRLDVVAPPSRPVAGPAPSVADPMPTPAAPIAQPAVTASPPVPKKPWWRRLRLWPFGPRAAALGPVGTAHVEARLAFLLQADTTTPPSVPPPAPPSPPRLSVAADQWPYEGPTVARLLAEFVQKKGLDATTIGVADTGLGSWIGAPLPDSVFADWEARSAPKPNDGDDQDGDFIADDIVGAGAPRNPGETDDIGDVSLCPAPPPTLLASRSEDTGHGVAVASIASAYGLRQQHPEIAAQLPRVLFYRLVGSQCADDTASQVGDAQMAASLRFLLPKAQIYSLSWMGPGTRADDFASAVRSLNPYQRKLILIAAGNRPRNLDGANPDCPACLGTIYSGDTRELVVLVGAATRTLEREAHSGFGPLSVQLYAPAEGAGALDLTGAVADNLTPATSYATPYAAMAAALLTSMGARYTYKPSAASVRGRLLLSTWALANDKESPDARVVDLLKVAAVLHNAVEVQETDAAGAPVLRTLVGDVTGGLSDICQTNNLTQDRYQAIRLGAPDATGYRAITMFGRKVQDVGHTLEQSSDSCRPAGVLTLTTLDGQTRTIPLNQVTQILLRWQASNK